MLNGIQDFNLRWRLPSCDFCSLKGAFGVADLPIVSSAFESLKGAFGVADLPTVSSAFESLKGAFGVADLEKVVDWIDDDSYSSSLGITFSSTDEPSSSSLGKEFSPT